MNRPSELSIKADVQQVKQRMIEIEPRGFKYIVTTSLSENLGQAGRCVFECCLWDSAEAQS
jgi:hypothetical protein